MNNLHRFSVHVRPSQSAPGEHLTVLAPTPARAREYATDTYRRRHHLSPSAQVFAFVTPAGVAA